MSRGEIEILAQALWECDSRAGGWGQRTKDATWCTLNLMDREVYRSRAITCIRETSKAASLRETDQKNSS